MLLVEEDAKKMSFDFPLSIFQDWYTRVIDRLIDEPFVLASQATQVFYVEDMRHKYWVVVVKTKPREVFDIGNNASHDDNGDEIDTYMENVPYNVTTNDANDNHARARVDEEGTIYDTLLISEDELLEQDFINDEELSDDVYEFNYDESNDDGSKLSLYIHSDHPYLIYNYYSYIFLNIKIEWHDLELFRKCKA